MGDMRSNDESGFITKSLGAALKFSMVDRLYTKNMTCGKCRNIAADVRSAVGEDEIK